MSDLVENPEDRFSHNEAHIMSVRSCDTNLSLRSQLNITRRRLVKPNSDPRGIPDTDVRLSYAGLSHNVILLS